MKKRKDCFFGLHFDMHANAFSTEIGSQFNDALVEEICREVEPDFIQVDSKFIICKIPTKSCKTNGLYQR